MGPTHAKVNLELSFEALNEHLPNFTINLVCQRPFLSILPGISPLVSCSIDSSVLRPSHHNILDGPGPEGLHTRKAD